jgi:hypothetical protein
MRYLSVLVIVGACSSSPDGAVDAKSADAKPIDAMPDADPCANVPVAGCELGGLAGLPFDGTTPWTLTGTHTDAGQTTPLTETMYFLRQGCTLQADGSPITSPGAGYVITDTHAGYDDTGEYPHPHTFSVSICVSPADGAVHYTQVEMQTMPMLDWSTAGILTH